MAKPTLPELERKFIAADRAGDKRSAQIFANEIKKIRASEQPAAEPKPARNIMEDLTLFATNPLLAGQRMMEMRGMSEAEKEQQRASETALRRQQVSGMMFGGLEEAKALGSGVAGAVTGEGFKPAFSRKLAEEEAITTRTKEQYPAASLASEISGSLLTGGAAAKRLAQMDLGKDLTTGQKLIRQALAQTGLGGAEAGLYGFLGTEGGMEERVPAAGISSAIGAPAGLLGSVLPRVTEPAKQFMEYATPTVGQALGGFTKRVEEALESVPLLGDVIRGGQKDVVNTFSNKVINDAFAPIGFKVSAGKTGAEAMEAAEEALSTAYKKGVENATLPDARPVMKSINDIMEENNTLRPEFFEQLQNTLNNSMKPSYFDQGFKMSGKAVKEADEELGRMARANMKGSPQERQVGEAIFKFQKIFRDELLRQNPQSKDLAAAREVYKNLIPLRKASIAAGTERGTFTPKQLLSALKASDRTVGKRKYGIGAMPSQRMAETAQDVLSKTVPDSGTAFRAKTMDEMLKLGVYGAPAILATPFYRTPIGRQALTKTLTAPSAMARLLAETPAVPAEVGGLLAE
jgi:hypothetical protein